MNPTTNKASFLSKLEYFGICFAVFFGLLGFIPSSILPFDTAKMVFIVFGVFLAIIASIISSIKRNSFKIPRGAIAYLLYATIISVVTSSILSGNFIKSFFGQGYEVYSGSFLVILIISILYFGKFFEEKEHKIISLYYIISGSYILAIIFQAIRMIGGGNILSFGVFANQTASLIGKWNDLSIFSAVVFLSSILILKFLSVNKRVKIISIVLLSLSFLFLVITNFSIVWCVLAISMFLLGIYEYQINSVASSNKSFFRRISFSTLAVLVVFSVLYFNQERVGQFVYKVTGVSNIEVILPWQYTLDVAVGTIKESPFFGSGPNRFSYEFLKYKPIAINQTPYWNTEFSNGVGLLPTYFINLGLVGTLLLIAFLVLLVYSFFNAIKSEDQGIKRYSLISSFIISIFLWIMSLAYSPSHAVVFLAFLFSGIFLSLVQNKRMIEFKEVRLGGSSLVKNVLWIIPFCVILLVMIWSLIYAKKAVALSYFQKGLKQISTIQDSSIPEKSFNSALKWDTYDVYLEALSEISILKINSMVNELSRKKVAITKEETDTLNSLINEGINHSNNAIKLDQSNYYNYVSLARISEVAASLKAPNAYENTKNAYGLALAFNPSNPAIYLSLAKLDAVNGKAEEAKQNIQRSLILKSNYVDAVFFLSQIQVQNGEIANAIQSTAVAVQLDPRNPSLFFQLGLLYYNNKDYKNAAEALSKAIAIDNQYANAKYFLGLSYVRLGNETGAISEFEDLAKSNPDNTEVALILQNLKLGKSPFADAKPPVDSKPEKRSKLPVTQKSTSTKTKSTD